MKIIGSFRLESQRVRWPLRYFSPLARLHKLNLQDFCYNYLNLNKKLVPDRLEIDYDVGILEVAH
jgi:hypothetical protein